MTTWSKHPPRKPCYALFRGARRVRDAMFEHISEPVEVRAVEVGRLTGLCVAMTGRATKWPIEHFTGMWLLLELEDA